MNASMTQQISDALADTFDATRVRRILSVGVGWTSPFAEFVNCGYDGADTLKARVAVAVAVPKGDEPPKGTTHVIDAPLAGRRDFPSLVEVISFSTRVKGDNSRAIVRTFGELLQAAGEPSAATALDRIASDFDGGRFDLVVIQRQDFLSDAVVRKVLGSTAILLDGTRSSVGGAMAFASLFQDDAYLLLASDDTELGGWALFTLRAPSRAALPVHFFTIVQNGMPFIRYHEQMLSRLTFQWHWHIVEGVARLVKDTAWSVEGGGHIPDDLHVDGRSNDGTSEYLDALVQRHPDSVTLYRKPLGEFWNGKTEMVSAPLQNITDACLLWQIDADELWTGQQITTMRDLFVAEPDRTAAWFWCNYYVGPDRGISTRYNYAQNPKQEWLRLWRYRPGMTWGSHEPPRLIVRDSRRQDDQDVGALKPFTQTETERVGAVFDHFAYVVEAQARFKESYYGYADAVERWRGLQTSACTSGHLKDHFDWVPDDTMFDSVDRLGWTPLASIDPQTGEWVFGDAASRAPSERRAQRRRIVVDGIFFQVARTGIARLWFNLLTAWTRSGFAEHVVVLDRGGTAPRINGVIYRSIPLHPMDRFGEDAEMLQWICDEEGASLFVSTYYTLPLRTPSVFVGYDMIPEVIGFDLHEPWWKQKHRAIRYASGHSMISDSGAQDLARCFPEVEHAAILVAHCSVDPVFTPCRPSESQSFCDRFSIDRDFVLLVGARHSAMNYKNGVVVYAALASLPAHQRPLLICVGGEPDLGGFGAALLDDADYKLLRIDDDDLRLAYGAALAYICPSLYEGFGLPCAEAMAVGCPVLACPVSSIPEVVGDAALFFDPRDPASLARRIHEVRDPQRREIMVAEGHRQVAKFDQDRTAAALHRFIDSIIDGLGDASRASRFEEEYRAEARLLDLSKRVARLNHADAQSQAALSVLSHIASEGRRNLKGGLSRASYLRTLESLDTLKSELIEARLADASSGPDTGATASTLRTGNIRYSVEHGLGNQEGPYPEAGVPWPFSWQTKQACSVDFHGETAGPCLVEIAFANVEECQQIEFSVNGVNLEQVALPYIGWDHVYVIRAHVDLIEGTNRVSLKADKASQTEVRELYLAILDVRLRVAGTDLDREYEVTKPSLRHLIVTGERTMISQKAQAMERWERSSEDGAESALTIGPTGLQGATSHRSAFRGLDREEGPFPDLGIHAPFRWQVESMCAFDFFGGAKGPAIVEAVFANIIEGQSIRFSFNGVCFEHLALPYAGWNEIYVIRAEVSLSMDFNRVELEVEKKVGEATRNIYLPVFGIRLLDRDAPPSGLGGTDPSIRRHVLNTGSEPTRVGDRDAAVARWEGGTSNPRA